MSDSTILLDCTLRDGGYHNNWDFPRSLIDDYLKAMSAAKINIVELGLRTLKNESFKGACAFTTDSFLRSLEIPGGLAISVMINASELVAAEISLEAALETMFPETSSSSPVSVVRIACHVHEFSKVLPASNWLKQRGFTVGFNLMQVADLGQQEVENLALLASNWPIDTLYFADSMGSMTPDHTAQIIGYLRKHWRGPLGIHTHDNMGMALQNSLRALDEGVTWLDATVTGMGRGPGNAKTEYLALEVAQRSDVSRNLVPLMRAIRDHFQPMQHRCGWGSNTYYYLAGKYGIHPTYIQEMLGDTRYSEEDILAVIEHLRVEGGKKFSVYTLDSARNFYKGPPRGAWFPAALIEGRDVLLLGTGPGVAVHRAALEAYIRKEKPFVLALNTQSQINADLIDARVASHPVRLLADCEMHAQLPQPLITPASMLPPEVLKALRDKQLLDFGLGVKEGGFEFEPSFALLPTSLVIAYALAIATCGRARHVYLAGFDGYGSKDPRNMEMNKLLSLYSVHRDAVPLTSVTATLYDIPSKSIYGLIKG